jgi:heme/copper-type cytochrome/quinol oxidase subunit 2
MPDSSGRVAAVLAAFLQLLAGSEKSAAEEGRDVVLSMLVVGLIFVGVAVFGDLYARSARKRHNNGSH